MLKERNVNKQANGALPVCFVERVAMCELEALMRQTPDFLLDDWRTFIMPMGAIYFCVADSWQEFHVSDVRVVLL